MRLRVALLCLILPAATIACAGMDRDEQDGSPPGDSHPLAGFERLVPGEWRMGLDGGGPQFDTWRWGPGKHSIRNTTYGYGGEGEPWRELQVMYWHPGREQVCVLGLLPHGWGVSEGSVRFRGDTGDAIYDLYQRGKHRVMGVRWTFDGPDVLHEALIEGGRPVLAAWDWARSTELSPTEPHVPDVPPQLAEPLRVFEPMLGHTWQATDDWGAGGPRTLRSTFAWVPYADAIHVRTVAVGLDGGDEHVLDTYVYHHTGTERPRCLVLTRWGGVYDGHLTGAEGGAIWFDLTGYEGDQVVPKTLRLHFAEDDAVGTRPLPLRSVDPSRVLDVHFEKVAPND